MQLKKPARNKQASIFLVDDHTMVRKGFSYLINEEPDMLVTGEAGDGQKAFQLITAKVPDLVIIDISLPGSNGLELIKRIRALCDDVRILVISMHDERVYARRAIQAGARGYIMKAATADQLITAIRSIMTGSIYVSDEVKETFIYQVINMSSSPKVTPVDLLTDRELEILHSIGEAHTTRDIAKSLKISVKTVETHRSHIKEKLNLKSGNELIRFAYKWVDKGYPGGLNS